MRDCIVGQGRELRECNKKKSLNGVASFGQPDFTKADADLAACAYKGDVGTFIKGLAWNTNLGWINFEETGNYSTTVNSADGTLSGKAYGDNAGFV